MQILARISMWQLGALAAALVLAVVMLALVIARRRRATVRAKQHAPTDRIPLRATRQRRFAHGSEPPPLADTRPYTKAFMTKRKSGLRPTHTRRTEAR